MKVLSCVVAVAMGVAAPLTQGQPIGTAFTFQGELMDGATPVNGTYDLQFRVYDALTGGVQQGPTLCSDNVSIAAGLLTAELDFGAVYAGTNRYLEIEARADMGADCTDATGFTLLTPRTRLAPAPHAIYSLQAGSAASATSATNATQLNGQPASFYTNAGNLAAGTVPDARIATTVARLNIPQTFTAATTFSFNNLRVANSAGTFSTVLTGNPTASRTLTLPDATGTLISTGNLNSITAVGTISSGAWQGTPVAPAFGGTGANLSLTGGAGQYVKQSTAGGALSVGVIPLADLPAITLAGDVTGATGATTVGRLQGRTVSATAPSSGQVLKWSGVAWAPAADADTTYIVGSGLTLTGSTISVDYPDLDNRYVNYDEPVGGDLAGVAQSANVIKIQGVSVSGVTPSTNQVLTYNGSQWLGASIPVQNPTMGGDVSGTASAATVVRLQGRNMSSAAPSVGQVLNWNGASWIPQSLASPTMGGDVSGTAAAATVDGLQGRAVAATAPALGEVLAWNGTAWAPSPAPTSDEPLKIRRARVSSAGALLSGTGITCSRASTGIYSISYSSNGVPTICVTPTSLSPAYATVTSPGGTGATIRLWDSAGAPVDATFNIIIIGAE